MVNNPHLSRSGDSIKDWSPILLLGTTQLLHIMKTNTNIANVLTDRENNARTGNRDIAATVSFKRVAALLTTLYSGAGKTRNTIALWQKYFSDCLSLSQAKLLFEAFSEAGYLLAKSARILVWSKIANPDNWTEGWVENFFEKYDIPAEDRSKYRLKSSYSVSECVPDETQEETDIRILGQFTDDDLLAELQRREEVRKAEEELARKKALVEEFLTTWGLTLDDLLQVAKVI